MRLYALALLGLPLLSEAYHILDGVCSKQVAGKGQQATKDCSSYLVVISTAHQTITVTRYAPETATKPAAKGYKRAGATEAAGSPSSVAIVPRAAYKSIPPYAAGCKSPAAYSSACSRINVHPTTITVAPCTETVYKHAAQAPPPPTKAGHYYPPSVTTKPPAAVSGCPAHKPNFALQAVGGKYDGQYIILPKGISTYGLSFGPTADNTSVFHLTSEGYLAGTSPKFGPGLFCQPPVAPIWDVFFEQSEIATSPSDFAPITCSLVGTGADITLSCGGDFQTRANTPNFLLVHSLLPGYKKVVLRVHCRA